MPGADDAGPPAPCRPPQAVLRIRRIGAARRGGHRPEQPSFGVRPR